MGRAGLILLLGFLMFASPVFGEETDLPGLKRAYDRAVDPSQRRRIVARIARHDTAAAAGALEQITRMDSDPGVRAVAVKWLAASPREDVKNRLLDLLNEGGVRVVREALAAGLAGRGDGPAEVTELIEHEKADDLARGLAIGALASFVDPLTLHRLMTLAAGEEAFLRSEALRALAKRPDGTEQLALLLGDILKRRTDAGTILTALLVVRAHPDERLRPAVVKHLSASLPLIRDTAGHVLKMLDYAVDLKEHERLLKLKLKAEADGYGLKVPDPPPPPIKPGWKSVDLVFVIDATGSTAMYFRYVLNAIRTQFERTTARGGDLRVGIVTYRGAKWQTRGEDVLPLTHNLAAVHDFLRGIRSRGVDSQGSAASLGLSHGLARMGWRWGAEKTVNVVTDCGTHDADRCRRLASLFNRADGVIINVEYFRGSRKRIPGDLRGLAAAGGGHFEIR